MTMLACSGWLIFALKILLYRIIFSCLTYSGGSLLSWLSLFMRFLISISCNILFIACNCICWFILLGLLICWFLSNLFSYRRCSLFIRYSSIRAFCRILIFGWIERWYRLVQLILLIIWLNSNIYWLIKLLNDSIVFLFTSFRTWPNFLWLLHSRNLNFFGRFVWFLNLLLFGLVSICICWFTK